VFVSTRDEVEAFNADFAAALARQDAAHLASLYTADARLHFPGRPMIQGRPAIAAMWTEAMDGQPVSTQFVAGDILEAGELVVDIGRFITPTGSGKYVVVYERDADGQLRLAVDSASGDGPSIAG
jgi:ketosteroid isomerase-like protein